MQARIPSGQDSAILSARIAIRVQDLLNLIKEKAPVALSYNFICVVSLALVAKVNYEGM